MALAGVMFNTVGLITPPAPETGNPYGTYTTRQSQIGIGCWVAFLLLGIGYG